MMMQGGNQALVLMRTRQISAGIDLCRENKHWHHFRLKIDLEAHVSMHAAPEWQ